MFVCSKVNFMLRLHFYEESLNPRILKGYGPYNSTSCVLARDKIEGRIEGFYLGCSTMKGIDFLEEFDIQRYCHHRFIYNLEILIPVS